MLLTRYIQVEEEGMGRAETDLLTRGRALG